MTAGWRESRGHQYPSAEGVRKEGKLLAAFPYALSGTRGILRHLQIFPSMSVSQSVSHRPSLISAVRDHRKSACAAVLALGR